MLLVEIGAPPPGAALRVLEQLPAPWSRGRVDVLPVEVAKLMNPARQQVDASLLVAEIPAPEPGWICIGIADCDLFLPVLVYVSGLAPIGALRGVTSTARLGVWAKEPETVSTLR